MACIPFVLIAILAAAFPQQPQSEKPNERVITIERTGGFADVDDRASVFADGKVLDETGKVRHVRPARLEGFIRSLEKVSASAPDKVTVPQGYCSDCFMYTIRIAGGEAVKTFIVGEPIVGHSEKESDDARVIRDFLTVVFSQSHHE